MSCLLCPYSSGAERGFMSNPLAHTPRFETYKGRRYDAAGWDRLQSSMKVGEGLYLADIPRSQISRRDIPHRVLATTLNTLLSVEEPGDFDWTNWWPYRFLKIQWLHWQYVQGNYKFLFPVGSIYAGDAYRVHPGVDRMNVVDLFDIEPTVPTVYYDIGGHHVPAGAERIESMEWLLDRFPEAGLIEMNFYEFAGSIYPHFIFDGGRLANMFDMKGSYRLLSKVPYIPMVFPDTVLPESLLCSPFMKRAIIQPEPVRDLDGLAYSIQVHRPIKTGRSWLEALLWVNPTYGHYRGECFDIFVHGQTGTFDLPQIY